MIRSHDFLKLAKAAVSFGASLKSKGGVFPVWQGKG
jgi:hypothetical protein